MRVKKAVFGLLCMVLVLSLIPVSSALNLPFTLAAPGDYDRQGAYEYAQNYWDKVCSDGYFFEISYPPSNLGAETPVPSETGLDCAHFVSCCIGNESHDQGGGIDVASRLINDANCMGCYGEPGAQSLGDWLVDSGNGIEVYEGDGEGVSVDDYLEMGDVIIYTWPDSNHHAALYIGNGQIAAHSGSAWEQPWISSDAQSYRFIHITADEQAAPYDVSLVSVNTRKFPFIYFTVKVEQSGQPVGDLTRADFSVSEDGRVQTDMFEVTPPDVGGGVRMADIVFLIDTSGSMGDEIDAVRTRCITFANALTDSGIDYNLGLVRFGNSSGTNPGIIGGGLTDEAKTFKIWVDTLGASGSYEPGFEAIRLAIQSYNFRPGAQKVFLIITDEDSDDLDKQTTIDLILANDVTVHAAVDCSSGTSESDYCGTGSVREVSGGLLFPVTGDYTNILDTISQEVANTYIVQYRTDNLSEDGVERDVTLTVDDGVSSGFIDFSYIPGGAPQIQRTPETLALHNQSLIAGSPPTIAVMVTDTAEPFVQSATLYLRSTGYDAAYIPISMLYQGSDVYSAQVPGTYVVSPGLDYYIRATDGQVTSSDPSTEPDTNPYQIAVLPNEAPVIEHTPPVSWEKGSDVDLEITASDSTYNINTLTVCYRKQGELIWQASTIAYAPATPTSISETVTLPVATWDAPTIEYYIEVTDDLGLSRRWPEGEADDPYLLECTALTIYEYYAPVIYQDIDDSMIDADYITKFDYDGDWKGKNNWDNQIDEGYELLPYVYYSVTETETHYFICYALYHPRDWSDSILALQHENDMEGILVVIKKDDTYYGEFLCMVTVAHLDFFSFVKAGSGIIEGDEDLDGDQYINFENVNPDGNYPGEHPIIYIESCGHGIYGSTGDVGTTNIGHWETDGFPGSDGIVYYPGEIAENPAGNEWVNYALIGIDDLWNKRYDFGEEHPFDEYGTFIGDCSDGVGDGITKFCQQNSANAPWGWDDSGDGPIQRGEIFDNPAKLIDHYFDGLGDNYSRVYLDVSYTDTKSWRQNLQPGDILLSRSDSSFSRALGIWDEWTHVGIYVGNNEVIEAILGGVVKRPMYYWDYPNLTWVEVLRVDEASSTEKQSAILFTTDQVGKLYQIPGLSEYPGMPIPIYKSYSALSPWWYCSELVWAAYMNEEINIEDGPDLWVVAPQEIHDYLIGSTQPQGSFVGFHMEKRPEDLITLVIGVFSPVSIIVTDPDGFVVSNTTIGIPGAVYLVDDFDGDGDPDYSIGLPEWKNGEYLITVIPDPEADPADTYTLKLWSGDQAIILAQDVPVSDIPTGGYAVMLSEAGINAPVADAGNDQRILVDTLVTLDGNSSSDPYGDPLTFAWTQTGGPEVILSDTTTVDPTFTPTVVGSYTFSLVVNDGSNDSLPDEVVITVKESNSAPVLADGAVVPSSGYTTTTFTYSVNYTDADNDSPLSITVSIDGGAPQGMSVRAREDGDYTNGEFYEYTATGAELGLGSHTFQFTANDGILDATGDIGEHDGPTVSSPGGGGPGGGGSSTTVALPIDENGVFTDTYSITSDDGNVEFTVYEGTTGLTAEGEPLSEITITEMENTPEPPEGANVIGLAYDLEPDGATFDNLIPPPATISFTYNPADIPEGVNETDLVIAVWDEDICEWIELVCTVDLVNHIITAEVYGFSAFSVMTFPPVVTTSGSDVISINSVRLNGSLADMGTASLVDVSFEWGETRGGPYTNQTTVQSMSATGDFSCSLSDLEVEITYYFRAKAVSTCTICGEEVSFVLPAVSPSVTTGDASDITDDSATLHAILEDLGTLGVAKVSFEWGESQGGPYTNQTKSEIAYTPGDCCFTLTGLEPGKTYYYRGVVTSTNTIYSDERSFETPSPQPLLSPAAFSLSNLAISPEEIIAGDSITISVSVSNTGEQEGSHTVTLNIGGVTEGTQEVTLNAGSSRTVSFTIIKDTAGDYEVTIDGQQVTFEVLPPPTAVNWPLIWGVIAAVVVILAAIFLVTWRRRVALN